MTFDTIKEIINNILACLLALSVVIEITPIKINPWRWLAKQIGKAINKDLTVKVDDMDNKLSKHIEADEAESIRNCRSRILRFSDEILIGVKHTKEHFDEILEDIDIYEKYCKDHPKFPNSKATISINNIREVYKNCLQKGSFLVNTK